MEHFHGHDPENKTPAFKYQNNSVLMYLLQRPLDVHVLAALVPFAHSLRPTNGFFLHCVYRLLFSLLDFLVHLGLGYNLSLKFLSGFYAVMWQKRKWK